MKKKIEVQGLKIRLEPVNEIDYISITDIAKKATNGKPAFSIASWLKNTNTIRFLYTWEKLHNQDIKVVQMHYLLEKASNNRFVMSPKKWIELINAKGIYQVPGRNGGTFAHKDIALNFCYWLSPEFQVYLIKAFQQLIEERFKQQQLDWTVKKITDNVDEIRSLLDTLPTTDNKNLKE